MIEGELVSQYFDKLINLTNQIKRNGDTITTLMKIEKVVRTVTPKFDHIVVMKHNLLIMKAMIKMKFFLWL